MATNNVANYIPRPAPNRGLVENGKVVGVVITYEDRISKVDTVIVGGSIVVQDTKLEYPYLWQCVESFYIQKAMNFSSNTLRAV